MPYLEFHIHTKAGSADSSITVDQLGEAAAAQGTHGLVIAEHFRVWTDWERDGFEARWGVRVYPAVEVTTNRGHIIVIGAEPAEKLPGTVEELLPYASSRGHRTIWAHPFRHYFDSIHGSQRPPFEAGLSPEELAQDPMLARADAIEAVNAICTDRENQLAAAVGALLGKPLTLGSDAHELDHVGAQRMEVLALPADIRELGDLLGELRGAAAGPAR
ncbi:MAG: hypothetical protein GEU80_06155 [Dehalococcoidia bacterium]|nr:hypothetical protein [Dehalococcoidia bacterium]